MQQTILRRRPEIAHKKHRQDGILAVLFKHLIELYPVGPLAASTNHFIIEFVLVK